MQRGGSERGISQVNAKALLEVFDGKDNGAHEDALALNAALSLQVAGKAGSH